MHRILFLPDIRLAGYPANPKAGYRISGWPDIRLIQKPDTGYPVRAGYRISGRILDLTTTGIFLVKYQVNFLKTASTIIDYCKHLTKHDLVP
jgi:hypothetical protein